MSITKATNSGLVGTKYNNVSADNYYMEPIATMLVGSGGTATVTFSNIPQIYKHLQIRSIGHFQGTANSYLNAQMQFNGDTGSNYSYHRLFVNGSSVSVSSDYSASTNRINTPWFPDDTYTSNYAPQIVDILDYTNLYKYKTVKTLGGFDGNGSGLVGLFSGLWMNTAPVTSITITIPSNTISQHSRFSLYGIRG